MYLDRNSKQLEVNEVSSHPAVIAAEQRVRNAINDLQLALTEAASELPNGRPEEIERQTTLTWIASMYGRRITR